MKKFLMYCLVLPLFFSHISSASAQHDLLTIKPDNSNGDQCGFVMSISNHNSQGKSIDEVVLSINPANTGAPAFLDIPTFPHWSAPNLTDLVADIISDNTGIAPNTTLNGLGFVYSIDQAFIEPPIPVTITWVTKNSGQALDSGTINPICTEFQSFTSLDSATVVATQNGQDPCFTFTMFNGNLQGGTNGYNIDIYGVSFQIENASGATMRPSKITPASGWITDSVTASTAYFHTLTNPITLGHPVSGWNICLRAGTSITKYNFVWSAYTDAFALIDRDTLFNISNISTGTATESDSLSVKASAGCLYNVTLKNYHLSNQLVPSNIVRLVLRSKTSGVTFTAAPNVPTNWSAAIKPDSIIYTAKTLADGIPDGIVSANQFSFSVTGPTTNNFDIGWETDRAGNPYPSQVSLLSTGTVTTKCTAAVPSTDLAVNSPGLNECDYKLTVTNAHNIIPQSNLDTLKISIPANSGVLTGTAGPAGWSWSPTGSSISSAAGSASDDMLSGTSQDFLYTFSPKTPGANVTATWKTIDVFDSTTGSGTFTINCTPIIIICDTLAESSTVNSDSCIKKLTLNNRKTVALNQISITSTNGWIIVAADTPKGWVKQLVAPNQVNYTTNDGLAAGAQQAFQLQFANYYPDTAKVTPSNSFFVNWTSTDINQAPCHDSIKVTSCLARSFHVDTTLSVRSQPGDIGVANFTIVPNPTHGSAEISFDVNSPEHVFIAVLDVLGSQITSLNSKFMNPGTYHIPYAMNNLPDATYFIRMMTPNGVLTKKIVLAK